jgi:putative NADH-flavin reductase
MKLVIFGATGRTGKYLLKQALEAGNEVTAVVRNPDRISTPNSDSLNVIAVDVMDPVAIVDAVADADAVITAIGPPGRASSTVTADSARSIVTAMRHTGARRLITISGSMVDDTGDGPLLRYLGKPITRRVYRGAYEDMRNAEREIHNSALEWTIMRPPRLTEKAATGHYRTQLDRNLPRAFKISRADLATSTLAIINDTNTFHRHVFVA